jgi:hypothetical protein
MFLLVFFVLFVPHYSMDKHVLVLSLTYRDIVYCNKNISPTLSPKVDTIGLG